MSGSLSTRQSVLYRLSPLTLARISVGFALIAALWLVAASVRGEVIALAAAAAVFVCAHIGRLVAGQRSSATVEWGLAGYGMFTEFVVYAGIATAVRLHPAGQPGLAGNSLRGTFVASLGGAGSAGVWRLAIIAAILAVLTAMVDLCVHSASAPAARQRLFGPPCDVRLPLACLTVLVLGARAAFLVVLVLGTAALVATVIDGTRRPRDHGELGGYRGEVRGHRDAPRGYRDELRGYRGDGRIAIWIGKWVGGRVPPLPPLLVGLLVTGVLAALGLRNLPGIMLLTPVEAMLLAAVASWHPHDGRGDWVVPPLLQAAEYVFIAEIGFVGRVWPPLTFAVVTAVGLRHMDLAYRVRGGLAAGIDRRGLGWEGRMIVVGIAAAFGFAPVAYGALAVYLWWRVARDWVVGWSARHTPVNR